MSTNQEKLIFCLVSLFFGLLLSLIVLKLGWFYDWRLGAVFLFWLSISYAFALSKGWAGNWKTGAMALLWLLTLYGSAFLIKIVFDWLLSAFFWLGSQIGTKGLSSNPNTSFTILSILQITALIWLIWKRGLAVVEENRIWVVEFFGAYYASWEKGLHLIYPFGGIVKVVNLIPREEKTVSIIFKKSDAETINITDERIAFITTNQVEFSNSSAPISVDFIVSIKDAYAATYKIDDLYFVLAKTVESALRSFFSNISIDQANKIKSDYLVNTVFAEKVIDYNNLDQYINDQDYKNSQIWQKMQDWGVEITRIVISDIDLPKKLAEVRERILIAEKTAEAAKKEGEAKVTMAEAGKKVLKLEGEGREHQIKSLVSSGLKPAEASAHLIGLKKWEAAAKKEGSVIIDSEGASLAGIGAKIGAGIATQAGGKDNGDQNGNNSGNGKN